MFEIGNVICHKRSGVCRVMDIAPLSTAENAPLYYVLQPLYGEDKGTLLRIPTSNTVSLSHVMSKEDADKIVAAWPKGKDLYETDAKKRKKDYETAITTGDISMFPTLLEGIRQKKAKEGHLSSMDQQFLSRAQPIIYGMLATALGVPFESIDPMVASC